MVLMNTGRCWQRKYIDKNSYEANNKRIYM